MIEDRRNRYHIQSLPLPADLDICTLFRPLAGVPWSILLDSANSPHPDGRFDIMVADPIGSVTARGNLTTVTGLDKQAVVYADSDPLALVQTLLEEILPSVLDTSADQDLPFIAGAMGHFGYDLGRQFEHLPAQSLQDTHTPDMAVGIYAWSVVKDNRKGRWFLCTSLEHACPTVEQVLAWAKDAHPQADEFMMRSNWSANMDRDEYRDKIRQIHDYLRAGDCYQVNLAQRFSAKVSGDPYLAYLMLRNANQAPFSAFIRLEDGCILSISPERFLAVQDGLVETKPIKGTRPRAEEAELDTQQREALQTSEKDRAENLMIVDLLRNDLSKHCQPGTVTVPSLFEVDSFAAVHHLVSTVTANLNPGTHPLQLLRGAFPGGSITGAPKIRAMEIIDELEPHRRNIYCGSIGYLGIHQDMDTSICIRTLLCEQDTLYCWAGGGIVLDSEADAEYQECLDKVAKILPVLTRHHE